MARGIVIPAVTFRPLEERSFAGLSDYQAAVGGYIEPVSIAEPELTLYVNEDGRSRRMSFNERATAMWWLLAPEVRGRDALVGDVVVLAEGTGAAEKFLELLRSTGDFHVEVQVPGSMGEWVQGTDVFPSWFEAAMFALMLEFRFSFVEAIRVTTA